MSHSFEINHTYPFKISEIITKDGYAYSIHYVFKDKVKAEIQQQRFIIEYITRNQKNWKPGNKKGVQLYLAKKLSKNYNMNIQRNVFNLPLRLYSI